MLNEHRNLTMTEPRYRETPCCWRDLETRRPRSTDTEVPWVAQNYTSRVKKGKREQGSRRDRAIRGMEHGGEGRDQLANCYLCAALSLSGPDSLSKLAVCRILCLSNRWRRLLTDIFRISAARVWLPLVRWSARMM